MNNPFDYTPSETCLEAFDRLIDRINCLKRSSDINEKRFCDMLEEGCMLGVLIAADSDDVNHTLYAFSGQLGAGGFHFPGFVGPVFDYLCPDGYFKTKEAEITRQNAAIAAFENGPLASAVEVLKCEEQRFVKVIGEFKDRCRQSKLERDKKRAEGSADEEQLKEMIRESQFEKAELHRLKKRCNAELEPLITNIKRLETQRDEMKKKRKMDSENLQKWLFDKFNLLNALGEEKSLSEIFAETPIGIPPSGAGECCAPKLLQAAYLQGLRPLEIAEFWYGKPKEGTIRVHGQSYPACRGRCLPLLRWMLKGVSVEPPLDSRLNSRSATTMSEIIFENEWFCVVNKPAGILSVPGKGNELSVEQWLTQRYGVERKVRAAHRLDQDTSGLLIATFGDESFRIMQRLFACREVKKRYLAVVEGDYATLGRPQKGRIELPLSPDWLDRPRQRVDFETGKEAVTDYEFISSSVGLSHIYFYPHTGRTHQLRVHAASEHGLGMPIVGDRLYGSASGDRMLLHAEKIEFRFPLDNNYYCFEIPLS